jgi:hypothetical protein
MRNLAFFLNLAPSAAQFDLDFGFKTNRKSKIGRLSPVTRHPAGFLLLVLARV